MDNSYYPSARWKKTCFYPLTRWFIVTVRPPDGSLLMPDWLMFCTRVLFGLLFIFSTYNHLSEYWLIIITPPITNKNVNFTSLYTVKWITALHYSPNRHYCLPPKILTNLPSLLIHNFRRSMLTAKSWQKRPESKNMLIKNI